MDPQYCNSETQWTTRVCAIATCFRFDRSGLWNVEIVLQNFLHPDAEAILNIPLRRGGGADTMAWAHERTGNYTVKSAYRALVIQKEHQAREEGQVTESSVSKQQLWKSLWSLKVVPKVRVF